MTTRLNTYSRQAFVRAVLDDTPMVDYAEMRKKLIQQHLISIAPAAVVAFYKNENTRRYLHADQVYYEGCRSSYSLGYYYLVPNEGGSTFKITDSATVAALHDIDTKEQAQKEERKKLEASLTATIQSFNSVKQAREALPEFAKYLPDPDKPADRTVPAIANLVAQLMAAGWPKEKAEAKAAQTV